MSARARIPLARPVVGEAEVEAVRRVVSSGRLVQGPEVAGLEVEVEALLDGRASAVAVSSGGAALLLSLQAAGVSAGDEVVVPAFTFPAAAQAALFLGARPVPADVQWSSLAPGVPEVACRRTRRTRAVVVAHAFGIPADVEAVAAWCRAEGIACIEDAACALGGRTRTGLAAGTVGDLGCFSLHPRKAVTSGEGGIVVCDSRTAERLRASRDYGRTGRGFGDVFGLLGLNWRMSEVSAAVGRAQLARLPESLAARAEVACALRSAVAGVPGVEVPEGLSWPGGTNQSFVVRVPDAARAARVMDEAGVEAGPAAYDLTTQSFYRTRFGDGPPCPVAATLARELLALPLYEGMGPEEVARVVEALEEAVGRG